MSFLQKATPRSFLVATPSDPSNPEFSDTYVKNVCEALCATLRARPVWRYHLFVISSTVMPGTISTKISPMLEAQLGRRAGRDFSIAYLPHFAALGQVVHDFQHPPFLLVGSDSGTGGEEAATLYRGIVKAETPVCMMSVRDAELVKLTLNVFLCLKVSFGNFLAQLCDRLGGANLDAITSALSLDPRIGVGFLRGGAPFGGACLPRDIDAFLHLAQSVGLDALLARASAGINNAQYDLIEEKVLEGEPSCVALLGLSFKSGTPVNDCSLAFELIRRLERRAIRVLAFDPILQARVAAGETFGRALTRCETLEECIAEAGTIVVCNSDPAFAGLANNVPADRRIIDPWGCVYGPHSGLVKPGRITKGVSSRLPGDQERSEERIEAQVSAICEND